MTFLKFTKHAICCMDRPFFVLFEFTIVVNVITHLQSSLPGKRKKFFVQLHAMKTLGFSRNGVTPQRGPQPEPSTGVTGTGRTETGIREGWQRITGWNELGEQGTPGKREKLFYHITPFHGRFCTAYIICLTYRVRCWSRICDATWLKSIVEGRTEEYALIESHSRPTEG